jgi:hypothetical protein
MFRVLKRSKLSCRYRHYGDRPDTMRENMIVGGLHLRGSRQREYCRASATGFHDVRILTESL